ncbi:hypothetical protein QTO34_000118, partial [Cnephaeus nilssonii]
MLHCNPPLLFWSQALWEPRASVQTWPSPRTTPDITTPENGTEIASGNPNQPSRHNSVVKHQPTNQEVTVGFLGVDPKFLTNMPFAKKPNKKGLKKMQANNTKAMSAHEEAIKALIKPKEVNPKIPKGGSHIHSQLTYIAHPKLGKHAHMGLILGSAIQSPSPRLKPRPGLLMWLQLQLRLPKVPRPPQKLQSRALCLP